MRWLRLGPQGSQRRADKSPERLGQACGMVARVGAALGRRVLPVDLPIFLLGRLACQQRSDLYQILSLCHDMRDMQQGTFVFDARVTDVAEEVTGIAAGQFETATRRCGAVLEGQVIILQNRLNNRIPPPVVALLIGLMMGGAAWLTPPQAASVALRVGLGGALFLVAGLLGGPAFAAFGRAGTTISPVRIEEASSLVTTGIYRVTRNPIYVALTVLLISLAVLLARPWLLLGPVGFVLFTTRFQILPEERVMQAKFGAGYAAYRRRVRRWL